MEYPEGSFQRGTDLTAQVSPNKTIDTENNTTPKKDTKTSFKLKSVGDYNRPSSTQVSREHDKNSNEEEDN